MGLRNWLGRLWGGRENGGSEEGTEAGALASSEDRASYEEASRSEKGATPFEGRQSTPRPADPLDVLKGQPVHAAIARVMELLDAAPSATEAATLLRWLRARVSDEAMPSDVRVRLSDFFAARGEADVAAEALRPLVERGDALAPPALMRLAELAQQRGDLAEAVRRYEEVLAIDIDYPGARERLARDRAPVRAGAAGATLLSPEAAQIARGRYALLRELGRGGSGAVFLSLDRRVGREVALKLYHPASSADRGERLRAEARVAAELASRHVVRIYDLFEDLGGLTMEHCAGGSLNAEQARAVSDVRMRRHWLYGVAHALAVTHARGWVHRDLKPGNVLLRADGETVLTDFGLARRIGTPIEPYEGTPGYVPPEVRSRSVADPRVDVYAFGAVARALLGDDDPALGALVRAALSPSPEARPRDGGELVRALERAGIGH